MFAIAEYMIEPGEDQQEWADSVLVTDESSIGDFFWDTSDLSRLSAKLQLPQLQIRDRVYYVAELLHQRKNPH